MVYIQEKNKNKDMLSPSAGIPYQSYQAVALIYNNISDNHPIYSF